MKLIVIVSCIYPIYLKYDFDKEEYFKEAGLPTGVTTEMAISLNGNERKYYICCFSHFFVEVKKII